MTTTPVLRYDHVARAFRKDRPVLTDVSFSVQPEDVVALLGRNGAGKTTLIHLALGMLFPQRGTVRVFGMSPVDQPVEVKRRIGYVAEDQVLPASMWVDEVLEFHRRVFPTWDAAFERQLLERFGLDSRRSRISQLSKGEARQLALVCALCHRPELLILDEPAGGLDPAARREMLETSIQLLNREGSAILFSSHHMSDVERLGERVVVLDDGRVALDETVDELLDDHCLAVIARRGGPDADTIRRVYGCLHVRAVLDQWHAVFRGSPEVVEERLRAAVIPQERASVGSGLADLSCASVPLEELFIELLGGERMVVAT